MQNSISFSGLPLTEIFQIQSLQSLLIKFWYLGLNSDCLIAKQDASTFKAIRKNLTFANCFTFQMPIKTYINFVDRIIKTIGQLQPKPIFDQLMGHLRNNKIISVSFELFGIAFLQLFGRILEYLDSYTMAQIFRKIYVELTSIGKSGTAILKTDKSAIRDINFEQFIHDFEELKNKQQKILPKKQFLNNPQMSIQYNKQHQKQQITSHNINTLKGRLQSQHGFNSSLRQAEPGQYPTGQKMKNKQKTNISCFMMGGFEIVDYSDSINQLHKKLLSKILLNK